MNRPSRPSSVSTSSSVSRSTHSSYKSHSSSHEVTQATLLRGRGDLSGATQRFDVALGSPVACTKNPLRGLGMQLLKAEDGQGTPQLKLGKVETVCLGVPTSLGQWNSHCQQRQAGADYVIQPGDKVCSVNGVPNGDYDGMLEVLADSSGSRARHLRVERELGHVLAPVATCVKKDISEALTAAFGNRASLTSCGKAAESTHAKRMQGKKRSGASTPDSTRVPSLLSLDGDTDSEVGSSWSSPRLITERRMHKFAEMLGGTK